MYRVLITDDEKIEREGIKFLLAQEEGEYEIHEAANGRQALNVLRSEEIDFLLTDIKMPHMDGLELASKVREEYPNLPIVIFSGYSDFAFAQEAMRYGVKDYVLKPVDPDTFHTTIGKVKAELQSIRSKKQKEEKGKNFLLQYFLQTYLYSGNEEVLKKAGEILDESNWEQWHCAILIESDKAFFDNVPDNIDEELMQGLHRNFFYLNSQAISGLSGTHKNPVQIGSCSGKNGVGNLPARKRDLTVLFQGFPKITIRSSHDQLFFCTGQCHIEDPELFTKTVLLVLSADQPLDQSRSSHTLIQIHIVKS